MVQACSIMETALQRMDANLSSDMLNDVFTFLFSYFPVTYLTPPIVAGATDVVRSVVPVSYTHLTLPTILRV